MRSRPVLVVLISMSFVISSLLSTQVASAAAKAGAKCPKVNTTTTVNGFKFTCVKMGQKIVWSKGVKIGTKSSGTGITENQPTVVPAPSASPKAVTYFAQWRECSEATGGHEGWVVGKNNNLSEFVFLRCTNSFNQDGSPVVVWQRPDDAAKIDQTTLKAIDGSGFIPPVYSHEVIHPDWYSFSISNHKTGPNSFEDLFANRRGIAFAAWRKMSDAISANVGSSPTVEIFIGPKTKPYSDRGSSTIAFFHKVIASNNGMKKVKVYYYNREDQAWAANQINTAIGAREVELALRNLGGPLAQCYGTTSCNTSGAWTTSDGVGYIFIGVPDRPNNRNLLSTVEPGEYFHAAWRYFYAKEGSLQSGLSPSIFPANQPPFWLNIGYEEIASDFTESDLSFRKYKSLMISSGNSVSKVIPQFNSDWLNEYLDIKNLGNRWSDAHSGPPNDQAMILGPRISEMFIALKGPDVILDFYIRMSKGQSFEKSFEEIFGSSWKEAAPEISKVLLDEFNSDY